MAGYNGDASIQFIELLVESNADKNWSGSGSNPGKVMLTTFDAFNNQTNRFVSGVSPGEGAQTILLATEAFSQLNGVPIPDIFIPKLINANDGKLCIENNSDNSNVTHIKYCVSYGGFSPQDNNIPHITQALPILGSVSLSRVNDFAFDENADQNSDFQILTPTPANTRSDNSTDILENRISNGTHNFISQNLMAQGKTLFEKETFQGNGRTCQTCHIPPFFDMTPKHIQQKNSDDTLFIGDASNNVNQIVLTTNSITGFTQPSDLIGSIHDSDGNQAEIITGTGNRYLIRGGDNLAGEIQDTFGNSGILSQLIQGDLNGPNSINGSDNGLESVDGNRFNFSNSNDFTHGRALVLENINGFDQLEVFRSSPHLLNLSLTAPYGLSGEFENLRDFTLGAIKQHFPLSLARRDNIDFRLPSENELNALVAFQESLSRMIPDNNGEFVLPISNVRTEIQKIGFFEFLNVGCANCHFGPTLSDHITDLNRLGLTKNAFDTGVADLTINQLDSLPTESLNQEDSENNRDFDVPQLLEIRHTAPYFHDNSVNSLEDILTFYNSTIFKNATKDFVVEGIAGNLGLDDFSQSPFKQRAVVEFLKTLSLYPFQYTRFLHFGETNLGSRKTLSIQITNSASRSLVINSAKIKMGNVLLDSLNEGIVDEERQSLRHNLFFDPFIFHQFEFDTRLIGSTISVDSTEQFDISYAPSISGSVRLAQLNITLGDGVDSWDIAINLTGKPVGSDTTPPMYIAELLNVDVLPDPVEIVNEVWLDEIRVRSTGELTLIEYPILPFHRHSSFLDNGIQPKNLLISANSPNDNMFPLGTTVISTLVTDIDGNVLTVKQNVVVTDPPDETSPAFELLPTIEIDSETIPANVVLALPNVSDDSEIQSLFNDAPENYSEGSTIVTWTAIDEFDNVATATQTVVVNHIVDNIPPVFNPIDSITAEASALMTSLILQEPVVHDDSGPLSLTNNAPDAFSLGETVVTWTASDANQNVSLATQHVVIVDTTGPAFASLATITVEANSELTAVALPQPTVTDIFPIVSLSNNAPTEFPLGETVVTWTASDANRNVSLATQRVVIVDTTSPAFASLATITVEARSELTAVALPQPTVTDIFPIVSLGNNAPTEFPLGETVVTWTASDANQNVSLARQRVVIVDTTGPAFASLATITVEANSELTTVALPQPTVTDIFPIVSLSNNAPAAFPVGASYVMWAATDVSGNTEIINQKVEVLDTTPPTFPLLNEIVIETLDEEIEVELPKPIVNDIFSIVSIKHNALTQFPVGETQVTWTATDEHGNVAIATQIVKVINTNYPQFPVLNDIIAEATGKQTEISLDIPEVSSFFPITAVTNNKPDKLEIGVSLITWSAADSQGNLSSATQKITVVDTTKPKISDVTDQIIEAQGTQTIVDLKHPLVNDIFPTELSHNMPEVFPLGETIVSWTAIDSNGNMSVRKQKVVLQDTTAPDFDVLSDIYVEATGTKTNVVLSTAKVSDAFDVVNLHHNAPNEYPLGKTKVTWIAEDINGNVSYQEQNIIISDSLSPVFPDLPDLTYEASGVITEVLLPRPSVVDIAPLKNLINDVKGGFPLGETKVRWSATDSSDNVAHQYQLVRIVDTTPPEIIRVENIKTEASAEFTDIALIEPIVSDNVEIATINFNGPTMYPLGETIVSWKIVDIVGNTSSVNQTVTVFDITFPVIHGVSDIFIETSDTSMEIDLGHISATDDVKLKSLFNNAPTKFSLGETVVTWIAEDTSGNKTQLQQQITVTKSLDTTNDNIEGNPESSQGVFKNTSAKKTSVASMGASFIFGLFLWLILPMRCVRNNVTLFM